MLDDLVERYSSLKSVSFRQEGQIPVIEINNGAATAELILYGGQVTAYAPHGEKAVLWLSKAAEYTEGKNIRGGVPVCWPWFGAHPDDPTMPLHGFVRNFSWQLESIIEQDENYTELILSLSDKNIAPALKPQLFKLELMINIGTELTVGLKSLNTGNDVLRYTAGLHSYFRVGDISKTVVKGVDGHGCYNKESGREEIQAGDLHFDGLTTRIYRKIQQAVIEDPVFRRRISVDVDGGESIVVWNPGPGVEERFEGFAPEDERTMLCVEAANPIGYGIELMPGESHCLSTRIKCGRW